MHSFCEPHGFPSQNTDVVLLGHFCTDSEPASVVDTIPRHARLALSGENLAVGGESCVGAGLGHFLSVRVGHGFLPGVYQDVGRPRLPPSTVQPELPTPPPPLDLFLGTLHPTTGGRRRRKVQNCWKMLSRCFL